MKYLLIDGNPVCHRAYHVFNLSTSDGIPTGTIFGAISVFKTMLETLDFDDVIVCWDGGKRLRKELFPAYKQKIYAPPKEGEEPYFKPEEFYPQTDIVKQFLGYVGAKQFNIPGVEADDLLGVISQMLWEDGHQVVISTTDSDMQQLIRGDDIVVYDTKKKQLLNEDWFLEAYGVEPELLIDIKALTGDGSDGIPGIYGVGIKTALKIVKSAGRIENLFVAGLPKKTDKKTKAVFDGRRQVLFNKSLVRIFRQPEEFGDEEEMFRNLWNYNFVGAREAHKIAAMALLERFEINKFAEIGTIDWFIEKFMPEPEGRLLEEEMEWRSLTLHQDPE